MEFEIKVKLILMAEYCLEHHFNHLPLYIAYQIVVLYDIWPLNPQFT